MIAANLNAVDAKHHQSKQRLANAEQIAEAVDLDMRNHWTVDATSLGRLSKAGIAEVLDEAGCEPQLVRAIEKASKADAVAEAQKHLAGNGWLPPLLRGQTRADYHTDDQSRKARAMCPVFVISRASDITAKQARDIPHLLLETQPECEILAVNDLRFRTPPRIPPFHR